MYYVLHEVRFNTFFLVVGQRLIVTDSWILKTSTYNVYIAHQSHAQLQLIRSEEHNVTLDGSGGAGAQFLTLAVTTSDRRHRSFTIRLVAIAKNLDKLM